MTTIPITGDVLLWAREFRGLSLEDAAEKLGITDQDLRSYEEEEREPNFTLFEKFGRAYQLPLATLFLKTRPKTPTTPTDHRTFDGTPPSFGFDFSVALSNVRTNLAMLHMLRFSDDEYKRAELRKYQFNDDAEYAMKCGEEERRAIGVSVETQLKWYTGEGFRHWRAIIEDLGVPVYLQKYDIEDSRGCSLWDDENTPAILVNKSDRSDNAWVFTLIHEYAHLVIRNPGISDLDYRNPVEAFCNRFAAAFLMPEVALKAVLPLWPNEPKEWDLGTIYDCAKKLKVSAQALALRLEELEKAPKGFYRRFIVKAKPVKPRESKKGPSYVTVRLSEIGGHFTRSVISAADREVIDNTRAAQALGISDDYLNTARDYARRQKELAVG